MILRLTTMCENGKPPLSPLGERVAHDGVFISRRGPGEGVPVFMAARNLALPIGLLCPRPRARFLPLRFAQGRNDTAGGFFHTFGAFPQVRRQSRFGVVTFEDFDAAQRIFLILQVEAESIWC
jgi:hypothetical protein